MIDENDEFLAIVMRNKMKRYNCDKSKPDNHIYKNGLCISCQFLKDKRLIKKKQKEK